MLTRLCTVDEVVSKTQSQKSLCAAAAALVMFSLAAANSFAWNIPGHMLSGALAHHLLERESPSTVPKVRSVLENHRWFADRWRDDLTKLPESERDEMLFMLAARWPDDIRTEARIQREVVWHFINWPFKPEGQPESINPLPRPVNILTGIAENGCVLQPDRLLLAQRFCGTLS